MNQSERCDSVREPLAIEQLVSRDSRRVTDEVDDLSVDPLMMDRIPSRRSKTDADRLLRLLDELEGRDA